MTGRVLLLALSLIVIAAPARAQVQLTPPDPPRWDASLDVGWQSGSKAGQAEAWNDWYDSFAVSLRGGRLVRPHLRLEAGLTLTSDGSVYQNERVELPGGRPPVFFTRERQFRLTAFDLAASYHFFENAWVHPFVSAGVQSGWERRRSSTPFPEYLPPDFRTPVPVPPPEPERTEFSLRPLAAAGVKFYVSERGFIRTELAAVGGRRGVERVAWRIGAGVDF